MLSSCLDTLLKVSKTSSTQKLFAYDCVTLYPTIAFPDVLALGYFSFAQYIQEQNNSSIEP